MAGEAVFWILFVQFYHDLVTGDLGDNACGGDGEAKAVALDDEFCGAGESFCRISVNQREIGKLFNLFQCPRHCQMGGVEDVELVDISDIHQCHAYENTLVRNKGCEYLLAAGFGDLFGVVYRAQNAVFLFPKKLRVEQCCDCADRSRQRTASSFIDSGDPAITLTPCLLFKCQQLNKR